MLNAIFFAAATLALGFFIRVAVKPLQWCFVPASIVAGFLGFAWMQQMAWEQTELYAELKSWPGFLIAVVFACMFLERKTNSGIATGLRRAGQEGIVVWIIVLGQAAIGLLCTWLLIQPFYDVPNSFGMLIETGFAGGHGTAAAMGDVFASEAIGLENGLDLGFFMATVGLVFSVLSGVVYVNLAIRRRWVGSEHSQLEFVQGLESRHSQETIAKARVRADVIDPLLFQFLIVALAVGCGWFAKSQVSTWISAWEVSSAVDPLQPTATNDSSEAVLASRTSLAGTLGDLPLFIYALFGGLFVRRVLGVFRLDDLIDNQSLHRASGIAMELLIVAAISTLSVKAIQSAATPLLILVLAAFLWTGFCLLFIARRLLPHDYWFPLGILNYGMSTGTTATGFTLLKIVDKDLETGAAQDYALASPLSSPFIGGGMLTVGLPLLVLERIPIGVSALSLIAIVAVLYWLGLRCKPNASSAGPESPS